MGSTGNFLLISERLGKLAPMEVSVAHDFEEALEKLGWVRVDARTWRKTEYLYAGMKVCQDLEKTINAFFPNEKLVFGKDYHFYEEFALPV